MQHALSAIWTNFIALFRRFPASRRRGIPQLTAFVTVLRRPYHGINRHKAIAACDSHSANHPYRASGPEVTRLAGIMASSHRKVYTDASASAASWSATADQPGSNPMSR